MAKAEVKRPSFGSILDTPIADIEAPKPIPYGSYVAVVNGLPRIDKTPNTGTDFAEFNFQLQEALDDVDEEALEEMGGVKGKVIRHRFWLSPASQYRIVNFFDHCGIDTEGMTIAEAIQETPGKQVVLNIQAGRARDDGTTYPEVRSTAPVK